MRSARNRLAGMLTLCLAGTALASDAETSAQARNDRRGNSSAQATARYDGDIGFARTDTRTGRVSLARGLAVGLDENGLTLSASHAVAGQRGVGIASNFNLSLGTDGRVSVSGGRALTYGGREQTVGASGRTSNRRGQSLASSSAWGDSGRHGIVRTSTFARDHGPRSRATPVRRIIVGRRR